MKKEEFNELVKGPDFNAMEKMAEGPDPCNLGISRYRGRRDIHIERACGNYFFCIEPFYSGGLDHHKNLANKKCNKRLYMANEEETGDPTEGTISKNEMYEFIDEYLEELEVAAKLEIERINAIMNEIPKLKPL